MAKPGILEIPLKDLRIQDAKFGHMNHEFPLRSLGIVRHFGNATVSGVLDKTLKQINPGCSLGTHLVISGILGMLSTLRSLCVDDDM